VTGTLRSPKQPNQTSKRFLLISPVVPDAALYSLSARLSSNSWNPGALVEKIVKFGCSTDEDAGVLWNTLYASLSVDESDDIWARFLQSEFESWRDKKLEGVWQQPSALQPDSAVALWQETRQQIPATRFAADLSAALALKPLLTRRQWVSVVESVLRLGTASHVLWTCRANIKCFEIFRSALLDGIVPTDQQLQVDLGAGEGFWRYGQLAARTISDSATGFIKARLGINLLLHHLGEHLPDDALGDVLGNRAKIREFAALIVEHRGTVDSDRFYANYQAAIEADQRIIAGKKGISSNIKEFLRHVLGQRQTAEPGMDSYDQGYFLAKKGAYRSAPWVVALGPVSVLALVNACTQGAKGPRTVEDLCRHLREYGIKVDAQDIPRSQLGQTLRNLGLVLDSPDAEGGMVVVNPFQQVAEEAS
jgi:hypothetical protein